jgi:Flp pilus assembly protein CpaB
LILVGAIVIGGLAAFLTLNYVRGVENENAEKNQLVEVLVATGPIPKGSSADEAIATKLVAMDQRRRADLPSAVVRRNAEIAGQVAAVDLTGGEIITSNMFVNQTDVSGTKSTSLDKGNVAITISVDESAGVAGLIQPGDSINILTTVTEGEGGGEGSGGLTSSSGGYTLSQPSVYAFQDVKVLAVGKSLGEPVAAGEGGAPPAEAVGNAGLITVQLPPEQAALLASIRSSQLYLTLNRPDYEPIPLPLQPTVPTLPGEQGVSPYGQDSDETGQ